MPESFPGENIAMHEEEPVDGEVYDSTVGWPLDHLWPHFRRVLSPDAVEHGALISTTDPSMALIVGKAITGLSAFV
jgi:hypothetical protein